MAAAAAATTTTTTKKKRKEEGGGGDGWFELKHNTSVYVTGLPSDATEEEMAAVFGKCGLIKEDPQTRQPRVKLYRDAATGLLKGDGLVTYLRQPSVPLALQILDGAHFRPGASAAPMRVTEARFQQKGDRYHRHQHRQLAATNKALQKKKQKLMQRQVKEALGWEGFDDAAPRSSMQTAVVMRNMFSLDDLATSPTFRSELEAEVAAECATLGPVERLKVYPEHPEGVVLVKFKEGEAAAACVAKMHGRWFGGRQLRVALHDGITNLAEVKESEEEQQARLDRFAAKLEQA